MSNKSILVVMTCSRYWKRFNIAEKSWSRALFEVDMKEGQLASFRVATLEDSAVCDLFKPYNTSKVAYKDGSELESKSLMLRYLLQRSGDVNPTHILFTDADIIVPPNILKILFNDVDNDTYVVSDRIDLDADETNQIVNLGQCLQLPSICEKTPIPKKRGMGWFQFIPFSKFVAISNKLCWGYPGYSLFDWEVNKYMQESCDTLVLDTGNFEEHGFLHLHHGNDGDNWHGTTTDW